MTKYYSLMGELAASTVILAVNAITDPTLFTEQPEISVCEGLVSDQTGAKMLKYVLKIRYYNIMIRTM